MGNALGTIENPRNLGFENWEKTGNKPGKTPGNESGNKHCLKVVNTRLSQVRLGKPGKADPWVAVAPGGRRPHRHPGAPSRAGLAIPYSMARGQLCGTTSSNSRAAVFFGRHSSAMPKILAVLCVSARMLGNAMISYGFRRVSACIARSSNHKGTNANAFSKY